VSDEGQHENALDPHPFLPTEAFAETDDPAAAVEEEAARLREEQPEQ
jgi:hypothetical protein